MIYFLLAGPIAFVLIASLLSKITPNYSWKDDYISELSLGKYGWLQKLNFIICGFSVAVLSLLLASRTSILPVKLGWSLGLILGVLVALSGVWDTDFKRPLKTKAGKLHNQIYHLGMGGTGLAYFLIGWGYKDHPFILTFSWAVAIFDFLWWSYTDRLGIKPGIGQRVVIFSALIWVEVVAFWTLFSNLSFRFY